MPPLKLYRVNEVADLLAIKPATVRKMISTRAVEVVRPTKRAVRICESELNRILRDGLRPRREEVTHVR